MQTKDNAATVKVVPRILGHKSKPASKIQGMSASVVILDDALNDFGFDFKQQPSNTVELGMHMLEEGVK